MKVHDIMSAPPHTCRVATDLATASRRMKETGGGMLVVFDDHGRIAGVVTDRDLAMAIGARGRDVRKRQVHEVMSGHVRSCHEQDDVHQALAIMMAAHVRRLPVLGTGGDLKGVLSIDDIILWASGRGGIGLTELVGGLRRICVPRLVEEHPAIPGL